jgi:hypothetical protein
MALEILFRNVSKTQTIPIIDKREMLILNLDRILFANSGEINIIQMCKGYNSFVYFASH